MVTGFRQCADISIMMGGSLAARQGIKTSDRSIENWLVKICHLLSQDIVPMDQMARCGVQLSSTLARHSAKTNERLEAVGRARAGMSSMANHQFSMTIFQF